MAALTHGRIRPYKGIKDKTMDCRLASNMGITQYKKCDDRDCLVHSPRVYGMKIEPKVTKSKNQVKRENHIRKRIKARATAHMRIVTKTLEGENIAPNHMVTSSIAKIKQTERSRFRMVNHNRIMSKGKACKCDGMNYMCKR